MTTIAEGTLIAGKIRLERPLARGGMGSVWIAHHLKLDKPVAVKLMDPALAASETARARFEREARASAQIQSAHVVEVHDYGVDGDTPYIVMELLRGEDLSARLAKRGKLDLAEATRIAEAIGKALRRAHELGVVHRDLKPGNVFLAQQDDAEIVKLLDFGIAKPMTTGTPQSAHVTRSGNLVGSPLYMSPEQIRKSKEVDHRSDLWSLGVMLYQMLTGRPPFVEDEVGAVLVAICTDPIPKPSTIAPELGPAVDGFFDRALARDPNERFQSSRELVEALVALSSDDACCAPSPAEKPCDTPAKPAAASLEKLAHDATVASDDSFAHAETLPAAGAAGTISLSASGRTHEDAEQPRANEGRRKLAAIGLAAVFVAGAGFLFFGAQTGDEGPGSPTLPLPPPVADPEPIEPAPREPTPEATPPTPPAPPAPPESVAKTEIPNDKPSPVHAPLRNDKPNVSAKPVEAKTGANDKPADGAAKSAADDDELLGLAGPKAPAAPR